MSAYHEALAASARLPVAIAVQRKLHPQVIRTGHATITLPDGQVLDVDDIEHGPITMDPEPSKLVHGYTGEPL